MPLLRATSGNENFSNKSCKVHLFAFHPDHGEKHIGFAGKADNAGGFPNVSAIGHPHVIPARRNRPQEICGKWIEGSYECAEGTILKLYVNKHLPNNNRTACQLILMRERAAYRKLIVPLCRGRDASLQEVVLEGNFDLLTLDEGKLRGYTSSPNFERFFASIIVNGLIRHEMVSAEQAPLPVIETRTVVDDSGNERHIPTTRRRRSLDV